MEYKTTRKIARGGHIVIALVQLSYIYTPIHDLPHALFAVQCITTPILVLSGIWITLGKKIWNWQRKLKKKKRKAKAHSKLKAI